MAHILIVDDERSICELLEITFRKEGHRVEVAMNGESARRKLELPDFRYCDLRYPHARRDRRRALCNSARRSRPQATSCLLQACPWSKRPLPRSIPGADRYVIKDHDLVDQLRRAVRQVDETLHLKKEAGYLRREAR